ncbi:hypothetical protein AWENTII_001143 [Aspergillus wentii]
MMSLSVGMTGQLQWQREHTAAERREEADSHYRRADWPAGLPYLGYCQYGKALPPKSPAGGFASEARQVKREGWSLGQLQKDYQLSPVALHLGFIFFFLLS